MSQVVNKCSTCKHLSRQRRINPICVECVITPNLAYYEPGEATIQKATNWDKLHSTDKNVVIDTLVTLADQLEEYKPQSARLYIMNWITRDDL